MKFDSANNLMSWAGFYLRALIVRLRHFTLDFPQDDGACVSAFAAQASGSL